MKWLLFVAVLLCGCSSARLLELETENAKLRGQVDGWRAYYRREQAFQTDFMSRVSTALPRLVTYGVKAADIPGVIENVIEPKDVSLKGRLSVKKGMERLEERRAKNADRDKKTK